MPKADKDKSMINHPLQMIAILGAGAALLIAIVIWAAQEEVGEAVGAEPLESHDEGGDAVQDEAADEAVSDDNPANEEAVEDDTADENTDEEATEETTEENEGADDN